MTFIAWQEWEAARHAAEAMTPPNSFVMPVSNAFSAVAAVLWSVSYILLIIRAFKDKSYGMPIYALCLNITFEGVYGFIYPPDPFNRIIFAQWMIVDVFLFIATVKYGRDVWSHAPLVANNLGLICVVVCAICLWWQLALAAVLVPAIGRKVVFFSSWPLQIIISVGSIEQILSRGNTRGHSWHIWWTRTFGTVAVAACFIYRAYYWPERFGYALDPVGSFLIYVSMFVDFIYPFVFVAIQKRERKVLGGGRMENGKSK